MKMITNSAFLEHCPIYKMLFTHTDTHTHLRGRYYYSPVGYSVITLLQIGKPGLGEAICLGQDHKANKEIEQT